MPIVYDTNSYLSTLVFTSPDFVTGVATVTIGWNGVTESAANVGVLAVDIATAWAAGLKAETDTDTSLSVVRVESATFSIDQSVANPGSMSFTSTPPQVAVLDRKSAAAKGPRNRGRNYWPQWLSQTNVGEGGIIVGSRLTQLETALSGFYTAVLAGTIATEVAIPQSDTPGQASNPILPWPAVVTRGIDARVATQRRRLRR